MTARRIQRGDAVFFVSPDGHAIVEQGVWLAAEDEAEDADGVRRVTLERISTTERRRAEASRLWVSDPVEARVANLLMGED